MLENEQLNLRPSIPTENQLATAKVALYLRKMDMIKKAARGYATTRERKELSVKSVEVILEDVLFASESKDREAKEQLRYHLGGEYYTYEGIATSMLPQIITVETELLGKAGNIGILRTISTIRKAALSIAPLTNERRAHLFTAAGYDKDETSFILRQIGKGAFISNVYGTMGEQGARLVGIWAAFNPALKDLTDPYTVMVLGLSYASWLGLLGINARLNLKMLQNEKLGYSFSFGATTAYYLTNKLMPGYIRNRATLVGSVGFEIFKEAYWIPVWFTPFGPSALAFANFTAAFKEAAESIAKGGVLLVNSTSASCAKRK